MAYGVHATKVIGGPAEARLFRNPKLSDKAAGGICSMPQRSCMPRPFDLQCQHQIEELAPFKPSKSSNQQL
jgi:hypothetical protein